MTKTVHDNPEEINVSEPDLDESSEIPSETWNSILEKQILSLLIDKFCSCNRATKIGKNCVCNCGAGKAQLQKMKIIQRVRTLWGLGRAGRQITDAVKKAIRSAKTKHSLSDIDNFLC